LLFFGSATPRLAPWAVFFRRFAAGLTKTLSPHCGRLNETLSPLRGVNLSG